MRDCVKTACGALLILLAAACGSPKHGQTGDAADATAGKPVADANGNIVPVTTTALLIGGPTGTLPANVADYPPDGTACATQLDASGSVPTAVPKAFADHCAGCHGPSGTGGHTYPNIAQADTWEHFSGVVRSGQTGTAGEMPAFTSARLSDDELRRIFAFLTKSPIAETKQCVAIPPLAAGDINSAYAAGLAAFRKQDPTRDNVACSFCHGPDPLVIAYLGYSDGDIMRRAAKHLDTSDAFSIVDAVHALRQKYSIARRDPLQARPLQPGGVVLPGSTTQARDLAFGQELEAIGMTLASKYINSTADAAAAESELFKLNRHALRIPIPFDLYSEDVFHNPGDTAPDCSQDIDTCPDHGSIADWMSVAPHVPATPTALFASEDTYLANPTNDSFYALMQALPSQTTMTGTYPTQFTYAPDDNKWRSQFLLDYCVRLEVTGKPGCYDMGNVPFDPNKNITTIWSVGSYANLFGTGYTLSPTCDVGFQSCNPPQPPQLLADITTGAKLSDNMQRLRATWFTAHYLHFDPTLMLTGDDTVQQSEYYTRSLFWANNDKDSLGAPAAANAAYSVFNAFQVALRNVMLLNMPQVYSCDKFPFYHPDLGSFPCTSVDIRSGYYPELTNFAEGKNFNNDVPYQIDYEPQDAPRRQYYQKIAGNLHRLFLRKLIGALQQDNWMCRADIETLRINRAKAFLSQPEVVAANGAADQEMFATLAALMAKSKASCPPFVPTPLTPGR